MAVSPDAFPLMKWPDESPKSTLSLENWSSVWNWHGIKLLLKMYKTVVLSSLLCGVEAWIIYQCHAKDCNHFHFTCIWRILNIKRQSLTLKSWSKHTWKASLQFGNNDNFSGLSTFSKCWPTVSQNRSSMENLLQMLDCMMDKRNNSSIHWRHERF